MVLHFTFFIKLITSFHDSKHENCNFSMFTVGNHIVKIMATPFDIHREQQQSQ